MGDAVVGVIGGGAMGAGIAQIALCAGHPVVLLEVGPARAAAAQEAVAAGLQVAARRGRITNAELAQFTSTLVVTDEMGDLGECELVVEAVAEDLAIKQQLFAALEAVVSRTCVLATNTSSLSLEAISAGLSNPERLAGMHFFNPAPVMPLVEIVSSLRTAPGVADALELTAQAWGKQTVRCRSTPGFVVNRVARPFYSEALALLESTNVTEVEIDQLFREAGGFRMGPLQVTDLIGQDVNAAVTESVWRALDMDPRNRPSALQRRMVDAGRLGRKTGRGFYDYAVEQAPSRPAAARDADVEVEIGPDSPLRQLIDRLGGPVSDVDELGRWIRLPSGSLLGLTKGDLATEEATRAGRDVVLLDLALDWSTTTRVGAACNDGCSPALRDEVAQLIAPLNITWLPDEPGLLIARTVALLVDEAVSLGSGQGIAPAELDRAVTLGLGYPRGPLAWGQALGARYVVGLLDALERHQPGGRFRVCTPLRRAALSGSPLDGG